MPEWGTLGSVRGDASNGIPYRDGQTAVVVKAGDLSATSPMSLPSNQHTGGSGA